MTYGRLLDLRIFFDRQEVMQCPCQRRKKVINHWWLAISDCPGKEVFANSLRFWDCVVPILGRIRKLRFAASAEVAATLQRPYRSFDSPTLASRRVLPQFGG